MIGDVEVRDAGSKGKGVFALRDFARGEFIFRRRHGRVVRNEDIPTLAPEDVMHLCELSWDTCAVLLPPGCYLNHSCDPNAMRSGVNVFAWREIHAGDEITIEYRLNATGGDRWECDCGSVSCLGYVARLLLLDDGGAAAGIPAVRAAVYSHGVPSAGARVGAADAVGYCAVIQGANSLAKET